MNPHTYAKPIPYSSYDPRIGMIYLLAAAFLYVWTLAVATSCRKEGHAAMCGVMVLLASWAEVLLIGSVTTTVLNEAYAAWFLVTNPFGWVWVVEEPKYRSMVPLLAAAQCIVMAGLWCVAGWRYGRALQRKSRSVSPDLAKPASLPLQIPQTMQWPLIWKERREQFAILLATIPVGFGLALIIMLTNPHQSLGMRVSEGLFLLSRLAVLLPSLVAVVLGVNAVIGDMDGGLTDFWESRPISGMRLFWMKSGLAFLGIVILFLVFQSPYAIYSWLQSHAVIRGSLFDFPSNTHMLESMIIWLPFILAMTLLATGLLRRATYAVAVVGLLTTSVLMTPLKTWNGGLGTSVGDVLFNASEYGIEGQFRSRVLITLFIATIVMIAGAACAFTHRWRITH